jgi:hypothetical protein
MNESINLSAIDFQQLYVRALGEAFVRRLIGDIQESLNVEPWEAEAYLLMYSSKLGPV